MTVHIQRPTIGLAMPAALSKISPIEHFKSLPKARKGSGEWWAACCPAHEDKSPSLGFTEHSNGDIGFVCRAGCDKESILGAMGLSWSDVFAESMTLEARMRYHRKSLESEKRHIDLVLAIANASPGELSDADLRTVVNTEARRPQIEAELKKLERAQLDMPLESPQDAYHPSQIVWKQDKETGEPTFVRAQGTAENLARLVKSYGVRIRYNELSRDVEISVNGKRPTGDLARNVSLSLIEDLCRINAYPYTAAAGHLERLAAQDAYNPALDWVKSRRWDGVNRIQALFECLTLADENKTDISWKLFRKWFIGAAAILSGKANKFEHVLILVDPLGGLGKTRFFNSLCPKEFQADGVTLNPDDKDSVLLAVSKWLVELGEIGATFKKADIESLKAFMSRETDEIRPAYARAANQYQRRTAFFGSVNNVQFLMDDTNNRRFWPIQVSAVDYQHDIDVQQAWAEALSMVESGETWHLNPDENRAIAEHNDSFRSKDAVEELILSIYDPADPATRALSATEVLREIGFDKPTRSDSLKAGALLRKLFKHRTLRGTTVYELPDPIMEARKRIY